MKNEISLREEKIRTHREVQALIRVMREALELFIDQMRHGK